MHKWFQCSGFSFSLERGFRLFMYIQDLVRYYTKFKSCFSTKMVRRKPSPAKSTVIDANGDVNTLNTESSIKKPRKSMPRRKQNVTIRMKNTGDKLTMTSTLYKEIRQLQAKTHLIIPKLPFSRLVREILMEEGSNNDLRIQMDALKALQEACEMYMVQFYEDAYCCTLHAKRKTLMVSDMQLTRRIRGRQDVINH